MSAPEFPDEIFDENTPPGTGDVTVFAPAEDDEPEAHMSQQEVA